MLRNVAALTRPVLPFEPREVAQARAHRTRLRVAEARRLLERAMASVARQFFAEHL